MERCPFPPRLRRRRERAVFLLKRRERAREPEIEDAHAAPVVPRRVSDDERAWRETPVHHAARVCIPERVRDRRQEIDRADQRSGRERGELLLREDALERVPL